MKEITDKEEALIIVKDNGNLLQHVSYKIKNDKDVVLAAIQQNSWALEYASKQLKNDKEVVLSAIKENENSLYFASDELKSQIGDGDPIISLKELIQIEQEKAQLENKIHFDFKQRKNNIKYDNRN